MAAAKEVSQLEEPTMETLAKAISSGSLRGARGNSGVILLRLLPYALRSQHKNIPDRLFPLQVQRLFLHLLLLLLKLYPPLVTSEIKFGYCTEFIIMLEKQYDAETEREFKSYLESLGDSIVVVSDEDIVKVHVHTNDPGLAIQRALTYG